MDKFMVNARFAGEYQDADIFDVKNTSDNLLIGCKTEKKQRKTIKTYINKTVQRGYSLMMGCFI